MSFTKTISTIAALSTIAGVSVTAWRVADVHEESKSSVELQQKIADLEKKLTEATAPKEAPQPLTLPPAPQAILPPPPPLPQPTPDETKNQTNP